jgi:hypothetical protein
MHDVSPHCACCGASSKIWPSLGCACASPAAGSPSTGAPLCDGPQPAMIKPNKRSERANCIFMGWRMLTQIAEKKLEQLLRSWS